MANWRILGGERVKAWQYVEFTVTRGVFHAERLEFSPFPLIGTRPRRSRTKPFEVSRSATRALTWISPGAPWLSIRLAVFTVSPKSVGGPLVPADCAGFDRPGRRRLWRGTLDGDNCHT